MKIICFHQSADLYGSDRSFLQVIEYLKVSGRFEQIDVVLPRSGPLSDKLMEIGIKILFMDLSLLSKTYLKTFQWGKIIFPLASFQKKKELIEQYDIWYVNTSVILDFYLLGPFLKTKKIIHIREIPAPWLGKILSVLISRSNPLVIFNSDSTRKSFSPFKKSVVIHNAFEGYSGYGSKTESKGTALKLLLIGRLNSWKGQDFIIKALAKIAHENFHLRIVGSTSEGNEKLLVDLQELVKLTQMEDKVEFVSFIENPEAEYASADIVLIPSLKPEPFGRTAIEAMSIGKPIIAANHGGLPEIVEHKENGFLFEPGDADSFNKFLLRYLRDRSLIETHGFSSIAIFQEKFSVDRMHKQLDQVITL